MTLPVYGLTAAALLSIVLTACGGSGGDTAPPVGAVPSPTPSASPTPPPAAAQLTVNAGVSAASKTAGASSDVFANADPPGFLFDRWSGDTSVLLQPFERQSAVVALTQAAAVTALFKSAPAFTPQSTVLNGLPTTDPAAVNAYWFFPQANPKGVIVRFHGSGGNGRNNFTKVEEGKFSRDAVADGFAVVSLDSNDRVSKQWDNTVNPSNPAANIDVANVQKLLSQLKSQGLMSDATPVFASGHSNGGAFSPRVAFLLGWKASHVSCASSNTQLTQASNIPTIWTVQKNDPVINDAAQGKNGNADALANYNILLARGIAAQFIEFAPSAVYPTRFAQISGVTQTDSSAIYTAFKNGGLLDADNFQTQSPRISNWESLLPLVYQAYKQDIDGELQTAFADHQFSAAASYRVLSFFRQRL